MEEFGQKDGGKKKITNGGAHRDALPGLCNARAGGARKSPQEQICAKKAQLPHDTNLELPCDGID